MPTLPCSLNLVNVSESPTVGAVVVREAMEVNILTEGIDSWEGER